MKVLKGRFNSGWIPENIKGLTKVNLFSIFISMVNLLTDVNEAEQFLKEIGMVVVKNSTPMYSTMPCEVAGAITHPELDDFFTSTAIFVYFLPNIGYQIFKLTGLKPNGTVTIDRHPAHSTYIVPGKPGWKEKMINQIEQIRYDLTRYYKIRKNRELDETLKILKG